MIPDGLNGIVPAVVACAAVLVVLWWRWRRSCGGRADRAALWKLRR